MYSSNWDVRLGLVFFVNLGVGMEGGVMHWFGRLTCNWFEPNPFGLKMTRICFAVKKAVQDHLQIGTG